MKPIGKVAVGSHTAAAGGTGVVKRITKAKKALRDMFGQPREGF